MTIHVAYEIRVQLNGNWRVEGIFDDEELAIAAAERLEARFSKRPIVVLQEVYDVARNHLKSRSIYRSGRTRSVRGQRSHSRVWLSLITFASAALIYFGFFYVR